MRLQNIIDSLEPSVSAKVECVIEKHSREWASDRISKIVENALNDAVRMLKLNIPREQYRHFECLLSRSQRKDMDDSIRLAIAKMMDEQSHYPEHVHDFKCALSKSQWEEMDKAASRAMMD